MRSWSTVGASRRPLGGIEGMDTGYGLVLIAMAIGGLIWLWEEHVSGWISGWRAYRMSDERWRATYLRRDELASAPAPERQWSLPPEQPTAAPYGPPGGPQEPRPRHLWAREDTSG